MYDLQYNGGKQVHAATGLIAACVHKSALSSSQPTGQSTMYLYDMDLQTILDVLIVTKFKCHVSKICPTNVFVHRSKVQMTAVS